MRVVRTEWSVGWPLGQIAIRLGLAGRIYIYSTTFTSTFTSAMTTAVLATTIGTIVTI